ncbi:hypothetical protein LUZ60_010749 [Juncus effusus]|nr:hypothetical protein LUZ60_010749 [Juncus effusus]
MSWGLGWKRPSEIFHLSLDYGDSDNLDPPDSSSDLGFRISLDWSSADDEDTAALRLQSQLVVALPPPQDTVLLSLNPDNGEGNGEDRSVTVDMKVVRRREPLRSVKVSRAAGSGQQADGSSVLVRLMKTEKEGVTPLLDHWKSVSILNLCGCGLTVFPVELTKLPNLEKLYLDNNKLTVLPAELGELKNLKVLRVDNNTLVSVPVELRQCVLLEELSLEYNKLVRPLLDFRAMSELRVLRLFGNPLEFLPEILPLHNLRHLSLANIRIEATESLKSVNVQIEEDNTSYFIAARHKLSAFFSLIFRFSSCHHPLLASALSKILQDHSNRIAISKEENATRQLISMISSENRHVVEQACVALSYLAADISLAMQLLKSDVMQPVETVLRSKNEEELVSVLQACVSLSYLAADISLAMQLLKSDVMQPVETVLRSKNEEELVSVLQVVVTLAFVSDNVAQKMLTKDVLKSLKTLCAHKNTEVQRLSLFAVGNLAFCLENRKTLTQSESLRDLLLRLTSAPEPRVSKAATRALAIFGENENLRRATKARPIGKQGLRILSMDGGGMKGLATVQILKQIEKGTGKRIHEMFDLICGTSTGGMLAIALGVKQMSLDECEEIYKNLGKLVFAEPIPKDNEAASWKEKLDQLFKSSSQSFRVVVHGSKHSAEPFERLLQEMCADEDGDLLIESAVKPIPKVFAVSTLVSIMPAQPFLFRNYQYPVGTAEAPAGASEITANGSYRRRAFIGSCKHKIWEAIRASSAAPYYLDDFSDDVNRWQDGAIVGNNPTIFAIREAQVLWPDTKIECLVSVGCGSVPAKARKGGWRYLDTGQVLIESSCSVERVEEAMDTLIPMLPEIQYFRFDPVDERCGMELDETDPSIWLKLEAATDDYITKCSHAFKSLCELLAPRYQTDEKITDGNSNKSSQTFSKFKPSNGGLNSNNQSGPTLGWRKTILLISPSHSPQTKPSHHIQSLQSFFSHRNIRLLLLPHKSSIPNPGNQIPVSASSPLFTGSFPSSPVLFSPDQRERASRIDLVPPLSLDGNLTARIENESPPSSPVLAREPDVHVREFHERLMNSPQVGVVHLALQNDSTGSILSWQNDVFVVAEPGELADRFIQSVKTSLSSITKGRKRKNAYDNLSNISRLSDLVSRWPSFQVGGILHKYIGRQTQVMEDNQEIGAFMFRRMVPAVHLTSDDVRSMVGVWRDRIILSSGKYGLTPTLTKSFLDSGAKAVICSSVPPPDSLSIKLHGIGSIPLNSTSTNFILGEEDEEEDEERIAEDDEMSEMEGMSVKSDWEESEGEDCRGEIVEEEEEEELGRFLEGIYEGVFREGARVDVAVQQAVRGSNGKFKYACHLPNRL